MESAPQNPQLFQLKLLSTKLTFFDAKKIADEFNKVFTNIGTDLANKIPNASKPFDSSITKANTSMESGKLLAWKIVRLAPLPPPYSFLIASLVAYF